MISTQLSLEISDTSNLKVMRLYDTSNYCGDETVENYLIEVLPVNKSSWVEFTVAKGFSLALNSSNLRYKKVRSADDLSSLPDGIYEIKQSIKPNIHTVVHYYHLRTTELANNIQSERCKLLENECKLSQAEYYLNRDKLRDIDEYLTAAKWMVEECTEKDKGKELYEFAKKLLEEYTNECKC